MNREIEAAKVAFRERVAREHPDQMPYERWEAWVNNLPCGEFMAMVSIADALEMDVCPFCKDGGDPQINEEGYYCAVQCQNCHAEGPPIDTYGLSERAPGADKEMAHYRAVEQWNRRAEPSNA